VPTSFSGSVRLFAEFIPVDTFIVTVSPMDENGYFTFGTNDDYTSSVSRQAKHLIDEVDPNMPRVYGAHDFPCSTDDFPIIRRDATVNGTG
jgi:itaconate CoA-transferase